jgi:hypothetical protein
LHLESVRGGSPLFTELPRAKVFSDTPISAIGLALDFQTWRAMVRTQNLSEEQAIELMVGMVRCAAGSPDPGSFRRSTGALLTLHFPLRLLYNVFLFARFFSPRALFLRPPLWLGGSGRFPFF